MGDQHGFAVDPRAVHTFGLDFQHDLDVHLSAEKVDTLHLFSGAAIFGARTASPEVHKAASDYSAKLIELFDVIDAMILEGAAMARAAHAIAEAYAEADAVSGVDVGDAVGSARTGFDADRYAVDPRTGRPI
ncbi:hypothetical protein ACQP00_08905 [Dactylosporangium sp. CS-047395]|uniref:hypothetical protein n=1 Tax=Dactylosporangium sp. CS-047395 TaxID=3239936 RepID=UPI003D8E75D2